MKLWQMLLCLYSETVDDFLDTVLGKLVNIGKDSLIVIFF